MVSAVAVKPPSTHFCIDAEVLRNDAFARWSEGIYGDFVADERDAALPETAWMKYLKGVQERPGWSVARVARESQNRISKATLFRMMTGKTRRVAVETVRLVAGIVGDDPDAVLRIAADSVEDQADTDPRLDGLDPNDPTVRRIFSGEFDAGMQDLMLYRLRTRRAEERDAQLRRELAEIDQAEEIWRLSRKEGTP